MEIMREEMGNLKTKIANHKRAFSWRLFECEERESCKESIIREFLQQLFGYEVKENIIRI